MGPYLPSDPIIKGSITGHMKTPTIKASATVEVGVAEDFASKGSPSVPDVKSSEVEAKPPKSQPPQPQPDTTADPAKKTVIHSLSGSKYAQKGGSKIGQKKGPRPKPGFKKENKSKYSGVPKYAQKSIQKGKGVERKGEIQGQKVDGGGSDNLKKVNENQSKPKSDIKTMMPHTKQHKTEQELKSSGRSSHKASFADMARRMAKTKV